MVSPRVDITASAVSGKRRRGRTRTYTSGNRTTGILRKSGCSERLFDVEPFDRSVPILDPCTGTGRIADAAKAHGYRIITADIVDRGYPGCELQDFFERTTALG